MAIITIIQMVSGCLLRLQAQTLKLQQLRKHHQWLIQRHQQLQKHHQWLSSGIRELLMSPDATQAAVACVVAGDGTYYWTLNYQ